MNKKFKGIGWFLGAVLCIICLIPKISNPTDGQNLQLLITYAVLAVIFIALGIRSMLRKSDEKNKD